MRPSHIVTQVEQTLTEAILVTAGEIMNANICTARALSDNIAISS